MAEPLNPYRDSSPWGRVFIADFELPFVLSVNGADRPEEWDVQKPTDKSGAASVWKGTRIADSIKIEIALTDALAFDGYRTLAKILRPKLGDKPPTLPIVSPIINFHEITQVACRNVAAPTWTDSNGGYWKGLIELVDYKPAKKPNTGTGTAGAAKPGAGKITAIDDPNASRKKEVERLFEEAAVSTLAGLPVEQLELSVPAFGAWRAQAILGGTAAPTGKVSLVVGDLELAGTAQRGGLDYTDHPHVVVTGAPGWERTLERPLSYQSDAGVRLRTVLQDLAGLAGEPIDQPADKDIGQHFTAIAGMRLRDVLAELRARGHIEPWRVDTDGVTRFGARAGADATEKGRVLKRDAALGTRQVGPESVAAFIPGNLIEGETIDRLVVRERSGRLEAEVWT